MEAERVGLAAHTPFLRVTTPSGDALPWVLVRGPIAGRSHHVRLAELAADGCRFVGITSYLGFPGERYRDERDYGLLCEGWLHCFREPDLYLPPTGPQALVSESDFTDPRRVDPAVAARALPDGLLADIVYVAGREPWRQKAKNWPLAARCLPRLAAETGLRILVVDAPPDAQPFPGVRLSGPLEWPTLLAVLAAARCLFVPAQVDPSPRVIAEALCLDVPVVVNRAILGGWQYVNHFTGAFFDGEEDVVPVIRRVLGTTLRPRTWFIAHHGPVRAGARVLHLLRSLDAGLPELTHVLLAQDRGAEQTSDVGETLRTSRG